MRAKNAMTAAVAGASRRTIQPPCVLSTCIGATCSCAASDSSDSWSTYDARSRPVAATQSSAKPRLAARAPALKLRHSELAAVEDDRRDDDHANERDRERKVRVDRGGLLSVRRAETRKGVAEVMDDEDADREQRKEPDCAGVARAGRAQRRALELVLHPFEGNSGNLDLQLAQSGRTD